MAPARRKTLGAPKGSSRAPPHMVPRRTAAFITALKAAKIRPRISCGVLSWRMERAGTMKAMLRKPLTKKAARTQA